MGLLADSGLYAPHGALTAPPPDLHTARLRRLLAPEDDLDSAVVITDHLTGLPLSVLHLVPMEAEDGSIVMLPRDHLAAKYAMIRWGTACRAIALGQVSSEDMLAEIVTKAIVGERFYSLRARVLGLRPGMPGTGIGGR